jgi:hypothetical protein
VRSPSVQHRRRYWLSRANRAEPLRPGHQACSDQNRSLVAHLVRDEGSQVQIHKTTAMSPHHQRRRYGGTGPGRGSPACPTHAHGIRHGRSADGHPKGRRALQLLDLISVNCRGARTVCDERPSHPSTLRPALLRHDHTGPAKFRREVFELGQPILDRQDRLRIIDMDFRAEL